MYTHDMNMFKPTKAKTSKEYFAALPPERKKPLLELDALIRKEVPALKPNFLYNMPGYGSFEYQNSKKDILEWPVIALASQKNYMSLYVCATGHGEYLAEQFENDLGNVNIGKSCIRFKKIEDLNLKTIKKVLRLAAKSPGLIEAKKHKKKK